MMAETKIRPIIFNGEMVRAILDGRKSQARRVIKPQPKSQGIKSYGEAWKWKKGSGGFSGATLQQLIAPYGLLYHCPYGKSGDRLWVRETVAPFIRSNTPRAGRLGHGIKYKADGYERQAPTNVITEMCAKGLRWRPSVHMPRWASRITLEITDVRVERVQDISEEDALSEGVEKYDEFHWRNYGEGQPDLAYPSQSFETLWDSINGKKFPWESNSWVWVVEFEVVE